MAMTSASGCWLSRKRLRLPAKPAGMTSKPISRKVLRGANLRNGLELREVIQAFIAAYNLKTKQFKQYPDIANAGN